MNGWMKRWMDKSGYLQGLDGWMNELMDGWMDECMRCVPDRVRK